MSPDPDPSGSKHRQKESKPTENDPLEPWLAVTMTTVIHDIYGNEHETASRLPDWHPAAYVILVNDGSMRLLKGSDNHYDLPGGAIE
ncbi:hypothetical protein LTR17_011115 [Elasticomyces elasticus]|nr:hypothetical protein LTR17_011115 [Elasticomyces elasticus]